PGARQIGESEVDHLYTGIFGFADHVGGRDADARLRSNGRGGGLQRRGHGVALLKRSGESGLCTVDARRNQSPAPGCERRALADLTGGLTLGLREGKSVVAECQPFCVRNATARRLTCLEPTISRA